jgi:hypothetical protein
MRVLIGYSAARRRLALQGRVAPTPLLVLMATGLVLSYVTSFSFVWMTSPPLTDWVVKLGTKYLPVIGKASTIASDPRRCSYVMTIQWMISFVYALIMFTFYCPFSRIMKVAAHVRYRMRLSTKPALSHVVIFICFMMLWFGGDTGLLGFPTFLNGKLLVPATPLAVSLITSQVLMPFYSWFVALAEIILYWMFLNLLSIYCEERKRSRRLADFIMRDRSGIRSGPP